MAVPLEQFLKRLEDSGILSGDTLKDYIPPKASPKDAEELLRDLIRQKKLTRYQAEELWRGKGKSLVLGNYVLLEKIGAGGMGQVFKAEHRRMDRIVAIKMLAPAMTKDAAAIARFQREVKAAAKLRHPNIVAADDADEANGVHLLIMEYVDGSDLSARVKKNGPFPVELAVHYILQAARGLEFAHKKGVVHRDIKPANLLLDCEGTIKILDMGLARIEPAGDAAPQAELTSTGTIMGTVDYMAPEQALDTRTADARADIYALGCSLFYLLTGKATYEGDTLMKKLLAHRDQPIPSIQAIRSDVSNRVETVFRRMVAKSVDDRFQTMTEVIADLEACGTGRDLSANPQQPFGSSIDEGITNFLKEIRADSPQSVLPSKSPVPLFGKNKKQLRLIGGGILGVLVLLAGLVIGLKTKDGTPVEVKEKPSVGRAKTAPPNNPIQSDAVETADLFNGSDLAGRQADGDPATMGVSRSLPDSVFEKWMKGVAALSAEKQVEAVVKRLRELNPRFDGKEKHKIENAVVTELQISTDNVTDISPVQALAGLTKLFCNGSGWYLGKLSDLSPLRGMPLTWLDFSGTQVSDLSPLQEMPLTGLVFHGSRVSDLSPLTDMKLTFMTFGGSQVTDISVLRGMPLTYLHCQLLPEIDDLTPLKDMPLKDLLCDFKPERDTELLRSIKTLETINLKPASKFWEEVEALANAVRANKKVTSLPVPPANLKIPPQFWREIKSRGLRFLNVAHDLKTRGSISLPNAVKTATQSDVIRILDNGTYDLDFDFLIQGGCAGIVAENGAVMKIGKWRLNPYADATRAVKDYYGLHFGSAPAFFLCGIQFVFPSLPNDTASASAIQVRSQYAWLRDCQVVSEEPDSRTIAFQIFPTALAADITVENTICFGGIELAQTGNTSADFLPKSLVARIEQNKVFHAKHAISLPVVSGEQVITQNELHADARGIWFVAGRDTSQTDRQTTCQVKKNVVESVVPVIYTTIEGADILESDVRQSRNAPRFQISGNTFDQRDKAGYGISLGIAANASAVEKNAYRVRPKKGYVPFDDKRDRLLE